jgi:hypothetical protein
LGTVVVSLGVVIGVFLVAEAFFLRSLIKKWTRSRGGGRTGVTVRCPPATESKSQAIA